MSGRRPGRAKVAVLAALTAVGLAVGALGLVRRVADLFGG